MKVASVIFATIGLAGVALLAWGSVWYILDSPTPKRLAGIGSLWAAPSLIVYTAIRIAEEHE